MTRQLWLARRQTVKKFINARWSKCRIEYDDLAPLWVPGAVNQEMTAHIWIACKLDGRQVLLDRAVGKHELVVVGNLDKQAGTVNYFADEVTFLSVRQILHLRR